MDAFDCQILQALQINSRVAHDELGDQIGLSASAVQRRIKRLRSEGVIRGEHIIVDAQKVPGYVTAIVDVVLASGGEAVLDAFKGRLLSCPAVQQLYYAAGDADFVVILIARDMADFDALSRALFMTPDVQKFTSKIVIQTTKASLSLPLSSAQKP